MKEMKKLIGILIIGLLAVNFSFAQTTSKIDIKTQFHCANGKALIEKELKKVDGIVDAFANIETKVVTVKYNTEKQNKESLVKEIEKIGYKTEFTKEGTEIKKACSHDDPSHKHEEKHVE